MIWLAVAAAALLLAVLAFVVYRQAALALPTRTARRRLDAQIASLQRELGAMRTGDRDHIALQEDQIREQWFADQMKQTRVDSLEIDGIAEGTFEILRDAGIEFLVELARLRERRFKIASIGEKKTKQLLAAYDRKTRTLRDRAKRMDRDALDIASDGRLAAAIARHDQDELQRRRELEWTRIRVRELERRRANL